MTFETFCDHVLQLGDTPRSGWFSAGVVQPESVAEHSYGVAVLTMKLAELVSEPIDVGVAVQVALIHDLGESIIGDIPKPVKRRIGDVIDDVERAAVEEIVETASWMSLFDAYVSRSTPEGRLVKSADTIHMLSMALRYRRRGADVDRFFARTYSDWGFPEVRGVLDVLFERWRSGS